MNKLFVELYLDEDVSLLVGKLLVQRGFSALTTRDAGNLTKSDSEQLNFAVQHKRAILSHNWGDFEQLAVEYFERGLNHYGIIVAVRRSPFEIANRVADILDQVTFDEMRNQIRYI